MMSGRCSRFVPIFVFLAAAACGEDAPIVPSDDARIAQLVSQFELGPLPDIPYPADNPYNPDRIRLGRLLFFDPILGGESGPRVKVAAGVDPYRYRVNDIACGTCHFPNLGFGDRRKLSAGVSGASTGDLALGEQRSVPGTSLVTGLPLGIVPRNAPTVLNTAFNGQGSNDPTAESVQFLDGRVVGGLEEQARHPIVSRDEMTGDAFVGLSADVIRDSLTLRIRGIPEYVTMFQAAFADEVTTADDITLDHIVRAIGAYEREIITPGSRYDAFVAGNYDVFSAEEREGFFLFMEKGLCAECHNGVMLSDYDFHVLGVGDGYEPGFLGRNGKGGDFGRFHADPALFESEKFKFRTLTVRNVEVTGPYFHSGSAGTLREVMEFYNRGGLGGADISDAQLAAEGAVRNSFIRALGLTPAEIDRIIAFMKTTTAPVQAGPDGLDLTSVPERVPSGVLPPGVPTPAGSGPFTLSTTGSP